MVPFGLKVYENILYLKGCCDVATPPLKSLVPRDVMNCFLEYIREIISASVIHLSLLMLCVHLWVSLSLDTEIHDVGFLIM